MIRSIVPPSQTFSSGAYWARRAEPIEAIAGRWIALIERLRTISPYLARWSHWEAGRSFVPFDPRIEAQVPRIVARMDRMASGELAPDTGSRLQNGAEPEHGPRSFDLGMSAGCDNPWQKGNCVYGSTDMHHVPARDFVTYSVFKQILVAMVETFDATQGVVWPSDLTDLRPKDWTRHDRLELAWISYICPRFASMIEPPPGAIVEVRPNGGLILAATSETFSCENPAHLAVAQSIVEACAPFSAVPWTPQAGK